MFMKIAAVLRSVNAAEYLGENKYNGNSAIRSGSAPSLDKSDSFHVYIPVSSNPFGAGFSPRPTGFIERISFTKRLSER
jgi:hypothetical protein